MTRWLHIGRVLLGLSLALPFLVSAGLGFVWLYENGWLLWFAGASVALAALTRLALWIMTRRAAAPVAVPTDHPAPDAAWSPAEAASFARAQAEIARRIATPVDWNTLPTEAMEIIEFVAVDLSQGRRGALDFTLPEALLLIERVGRRYRRFLLRHVPFSDRLSVRNLHWAWRKQDDALAVWETGFLAWRGFRLLTNPIAGVMREAERAMARGLQGHLSEGLRRDAQVILLEEAAQAAIDLYSGRLKASDDELRALAQADAGEGALAPLRVLVLGQAGAGCSTVMAALLADPQAQSLAPVAQASVEAVIGGHPVRLIEGKISADPTSALRQIDQADLVIWVHKATRPARAPDAALLTALRARTGHPTPPIAHVVTGVRAASDGPAPTGAALDAVGARVAAVLHETLAIDAPLPMDIGGVNTGAPLNVARLQGQVATLLGPAQRVQRARLVAEAAKGAGLGGNLQRAGQSGRALWQRLRKTR